MAGYTRQDTANNIANGNVIDADDLDNEFNAVEDAFNSTNGHKHDGTPGEGAAITKVGPSQDIIVGTSNVLPKANNTIDIGSDAAKFKDGYFDGTAYVDTANIGVNGYTTVTDNTYEVSSGDLLLDVAGDVVLDADGGDVNLHDNGVQFGGFTNNAGDLIVKSGSTNAATFSGANVDLAGTLDVTGATTLDSTLTVAGNTSISSGNLTVNTGNVSIGGTLDATGTITGNLTGGVTGNVTGNLTGNVTGNVVGDLTGDVTGNADTATTWETARSFTLTGDVAGTVSGVDGSGNVSMATTIQPNSVALGTDTTGSYVGSLVAGTGVTITNNSGEGATPTVAIGQAVSTSSNVTFNNMTVSGNLTVSGTTTTVNTETVNIADNIILLNSNETGTPSQDGGIQIERGTATNKSLYWDESEDEWTIGSERFKAGTFEGTLVGNASTASTLATARTISLGGDLSGSASFNGSSNITITAAVANDSHTHDGRYYTESESDSRFTASAGDVMTGTLRFNDSVMCTFGSSNDVEFFCNGSHMYMDLNSGIGNFYIRDGSSTRFTFDDAGHFTASGNVTAYSDERLKSDIVTIPNALEKVKALRGVNFTKDGEASTGVIAQEVQKVIPEVVQENDEYLSVAYGNLVGVLIEAVKELSEEVEALKAK